VGSLGGAFGGLDRGDVVGGGVREDLGERVLDLQCPGGDLLGAPSEDFASDQLYGASGVGYVVGGELGGTSTPHSVVVTASIAAPGRRANT